MAPFSRLLLFLLFVSTAAAQSITGRWEGTAQVSDALTVPVHLELSGTGNHLTGTFLNGTQRSSSTEGHVDGNSITLKFAQFNITFQGVLKDGVLTGNYSNDAGAFSYLLRLKPYVKPQVLAINVPDISGVWIIPTESEKGEHAFRLIVKQTGPDVAATILRVDGDTGTLAGTYRDGKFVLSHFGDVRVSALEVVSAADGSLDLTLLGTHTHAGQEGQAAKLIAIRSIGAKAKTIPQPDDFSTHTSVRDPHQPLRFSFPNLNGKVVSNTDPQFKNKVVLVNITGSWCPNCHDEAPYLAELYRKYHARGLEIVALDFEEPAQLHSLVRVHAFIKKYGIEYTYLIAGTQQEIHEKLPQAVNLNAWPTTFFVGRDGLVHAVETGFPSPGSLEFDHDAKQRYVANIEKLLGPSSLTPGK
jgi:thiol-disulfide isomerase/thioredoxin